jgi:hypothetical protein
MRLFGALAAPGADHAALLTRNCVIRARDGAVMVAAAPTRPLEATLSRLATTILEGEIEEAGGGYLLAGPPDAGEGSAASGFWAVRVQKDRLAAAFEYERREEMVAAIPERLRPQSDVDLVSAAIWAFVHDDVSTLIHGLADDFTYTDLEAEGSVAGSANAIGMLLLARGELPDTGLAELEVRELAPGLVEATGVMTKPETGAALWRWRVNVGIEGGRIAWALRRPDEPPAP